MNHWIGRGLEHIMFINCFYIRYRTPWKVTTQLWSLFKIKFRKFLKFFYFYLFFLNRNYATQFHKIETLMHGQNKKAVIMKNNGPRGCKYKKKLYIYIYLYFFSFTDQVSANYSVYSYVWKLQDKLLIINYVLIEFEFA